jgi:hypothetical protein
MECRGGRACSGQQENFARQAVLLISILHAATAGGMGSAVQVRENPFSHAPHYLRCRCFHFRLSLLLILENSRNMNVFRVMSVTVLIVCAFTNRHTHALYCIKNMINTICTHTTHTCTLTHKSRTQSRARHLFLTRASAHHTQTHTHNHTQTHAVRNGWQ